MESNTRHQCLIYDGPPSNQLPALAAILQQKLNDGFRCLYLNSRPMVAGMRSCLAAKGIDVVNEIAQARLVLSSDPVVSADGGFDVQRMLGRLEDALAQAKNDGHKGLWVTGDMTWEFGAERNFSKLMEYEWKLEKLFHKHEELCGICQYHRDTLPPEIPRRGLLMHPMIFINATLSRVNPHFLPAELPSEKMAANPALDATIASLGQLQNSESQAGAA
jgi:hypothetical protein